MNYLEILGVVTICLTALAFVTTFCIMSHQVNEIHSKVIRGDK